MHPAALAVPLVAALVQRCGGWPLALAALVALSVTLGLSGAAGAPVIAALAIVGALVVAVFEWLARAAVGDAARLDGTADGPRQPGDAAGSQRMVHGRDELLSLASHDLRSALNAMVGWLYLARSPKTDADARQRALDGIGSAVDTQRRLVDQLLDATRLLSGRIPAESSAVSPEALLQRVAARLALRAAERSIELRTQPVQPGLSFLADPARAEESLCALVEHALAITPAQGMIRIHARPAGTPAAATILIEVESDGADGPSIPSIDESTVPADRTPAAQGVALPTLAIAIASAVTELQGGSLEMRRTGPGSGAGARLSIRYPAVAAAGIDAQPAQPSQAPSTPGLFDHDDVPDARDAMEALSGCYILLTDDRKDMLEVGATVLRRHGAHVTTARSGDEAIALYRDWARGGGERLLISDLAMPEIDGLSMIGRIRRIEGEYGLPRVPAVAFSAQADQYARQAVMQAGFDLFLAKPLSPAQLIGAISPLIGK